MGAARCLRFIGRADYGCVPFLGRVPTVALEDAQVVAQAIEWTEEGMDFADALHLARSSACTAFVTFDERLAKKARAQNQVRVRKL
jgi:predicted nucleic acid-binding protein